MIKEEKITEETNLLAIQKGFNLKPKSHWDKLKEDNVILPLKITQSLLQKWLREVHDIDVIPTMSEFSRTYGYKIFYIENNKTEVINNCYSKNEKYEQSLEKGLQEGLKLIKL